MKHTFLRKGSLVLALVMVLSAMLSFVGCASKDEYKDFDYFVMDTYVTIRLANAGDDGKLTDEYLAEVADNCAAILAEVDGVISAHNDASDISAFNSDVSVMVGADESLLPLLKTADKITRLTDRAFDYTLGALIELWNVNGGGPVPSESDISYALSHTGADKLKFKGNTIEKIDKNLKIDLGGIGKGHATQLILEYLATTDVKYGIVSLGGNIGVYGAKPDGQTYKIGIRDPEGSGVIGHLYLTSGFVSVSGDYERFFEVDGVRYHHILDAKTGYPADSGIRSVAVYSTNGATADALSTALFVMGVERTMELYESGEITFEAVFVTDDGKVITTPGLSDDVFKMSSVKYKHETAELSTKD
ncbi:MAG: FAD:protein FMN transferase [Ruminococcaceae bacterium]|nr:FAD:protein FMN transferase [Oscillospiraceae bacterium]